MRRLRFLTGFILGTILAIGLTGCAKQYKPASLPQSLPETWAVQADSKSAGSFPKKELSSPQFQFGKIMTKDLTMSSSLLDLIDDARVTNLVEEAMAGNPDLKATAARLKASGFLLSQTSSRRLPELTAGASRGRNNHNLDESGSPDASDSYQVSASISWELDVWGRISDLQQAEILGHKALEKEYLRAYDALAARVIQAWIQSVAACQTLAIEEERLAALQKIEDTLLFRYREGLGSLEDYSAARTRTKVATASVSSRAEIHRRSLRSLEVLVGRYPEAAILKTDVMPEIESAPIVPPHAALKNRPDIQAALSRIDADQYAAIAAQKNRLPALRLVAEVSKSSTSFSDLDTASRIWNLAAGLTQPIFQGGRLKDEAMAKEAQAEAAVWDLAQAVLAAMKEVEDAMDNETALAFQEAALTDAVLEAVKTSEYFLTRYRSGLDNIQTLLIAREQEMNIKTSLTDIKAARMTNRIDMALALGLGV